MRLMNFWLAFAVDDVSLGAFSFLAGFWYSTGAFPEVACDSVVAPSCSAILCAPMRRLFRCVMYSVEKYLLYLCDRPFLVLLPIWLWISTTGVPSSDGPSLSGH